MTVVGETAAKPGEGDRTAAEGRVGGWTRDSLNHLFSLSATKIADGLIDPKLVLAWLLSALSAPAGAIGALVPIREAGALLPQLGLAPRVTAAPLRKLFWAAGSALQGLAAIGIAAAALLLEGAVAWLGILACLALLAVSRALCSVSYKDALARTVPEGRRGRVTGAAASAAALAVLCFGAALALGLLPLDVPTVALAIGLAGLLWLGGAALFLRLGETPERNGSERGEGLRALLAPLREDGQLRRLVIARGLLIATALAPPFLVLLSAADDERGLGRLGPLVLASAAASILSAWLWGRLSDRSSRRTLMAAGALGALALGACAVAGLLFGGLGGVAGSAAAIFAAQFAYEGVRSGRKIHLTDMASDDTRARYTALSNTAIGLLLLAGGGFGLLADLAGVPAVLALFALLCALSVPVSAGLDEVQGSGA